MPGYGLPWLLSPSANHHWLGQRNEELAHFVQEKLMIENNFVDEVVYSECIYAAEPVVSYFY